MYKIMIPYRDRDSHLKTFVKNAIPFFEESGRDYKIIIIEQPDGKPFNLGKLTNVGFDIFKKGMVGINQKTHLYFNLLIVFLMMLTMTPHEAALRN